MRIFSERKLVEKGGDRIKVVLNPLESSKELKKFSCAEAVCVLSRFSHVNSLAHQAPLSMGFSRQGCWNGLTHPPPGHLLNPGIEPTSLMSPALDRLLLYH